MVSVFCPKVFATLQLRGELEFVFVRDKIIKFAPPNCHTKKKKKKKIAPPKKEDRRLAQSAKIGKKEFVGDY